jgi:hypothetical protein
MMRCDCKNCQVITRLQGHMFAIVSKGGHFDDLNVMIWNTALADNPCLNQAAA